MLARRGKFIRHCVPFDCLAATHLSGSHAPLRRCLPLRTPSVPGGVSAVAADLQSIEKAWLPFLDTYRTMCLAPEPAFRQILEDIRELRFAA